MVHVALLFQEDWKALSCHHGFFSAHYSLATILGTFVPSTAYFSLFSYLLWHWRNPMYLPQSFGKTKFFLQIFGTFFLISPLLHAFYVAVGLIARKSRTQSQRNTVTKFATIAKYRTTKNQILAQLWYKILALIFIKRGLLSCNHPFFTLLHHPNTLDWYCKSPKGILLFSFLSYA